jgi:hypothetical protein
MTYGIESISGRILEVGAAMFDEHCHTYEFVEVETVDGVQKFGPAMAASVCDALLEPGRTVAMSVTRTTGRGAKTVVWAVSDVTSGEVAVNEELFKARSSAVMQATLLSVFAPVFIPIGLVLAVVPGIAAIFLLYRSWTSVLAMPTAEAIRDSVSSLTSQRPPAPAFGLAFSAA